MAPVSADVVTTLALAPESVSVVAVEAPPTVPDEINSEAAGAPPSAPPAAGGGTPLKATSIRFVVPSPPCVTRALLFVTARKLRSVRTSSARGVS